MMNFTRLIALPLALVLTISACSSEPEPTKPAADDANADLPEEPLQLDPDAEDPASPGGQSSSEPPSGNASEEESGRAIDPERSKLIKADPR